MDVWIQYISVYADTACDGDLVFESAWVTEISWRYWRYINRIEVNILIKGLSIYIIENNLRILSKTNQRDEDMWKGKFIALIFNIDVDLIPYGKDSISKCWREICSERERPFIIKR